MKHICIYIINLLFVGQFLQAQTTPEALDTISNKDIFGLRVGLDIFKPARTLFDDDYSGFEVMADYRIIKSYYLALELGMDEKTTFDDRITSKGDGTYFKLGFDYNAHNNWYGLNNMIFGGLRYGYSAFSQEVMRYEIATEAPFFPPDIRTDPLQFEGLTVHWVELIVGLKAEVLTNLFLTINLQLKNRVAEKTPENFENLYIPGFGRTYENSKFGAGFGYGISYLIPIVKK